MAPRVSANTGTGADDNNYSTPANGQDDADPSIASGAVGPNKMYSASQPNGPTEGTAPAKQRASVVKDLLGHFHCHHPLSAL